MVFFALNICWCPIFSCLLGKRNIFQGYDRGGITDSRSHIQWMKIEDCGQEF
ncbi:hypothetical protein AAZX31_06G143600 [Glycine max]